MKYIKSYLSALGYGLLGIVVLAFVFVLLFFFLLPLILWDLHFKILATVVGILVTLPTVGVMMRNQ